MNNKSCYDCVHRDVCASVEAGFSRCVEDVSKCKHFMDKSDFKPVRHGEWKDCGEIEIGFKNNNPLCTDMCDSNGVIWHKVKVLRCPKCGRLIREYPQYISSLNYCSSCGAKMDGKEVQE